MIAADPGPHSPAWKLLHALERKELSSVELLGMYKQDRRAERAPERDRAAGLRRPARASRRVLAIRGPFGGDRYRCSWPQAAASACRRRSPRLHSSPLAKTHMTAPCYRGAALAAFLMLTAGAQSAAPAPPFDLAYRAWDAVTELARQNPGANISGQCGKTFRPFVIPGLRRQSRQEEDAAAGACLEAARSACANKKLATSAESAKKCEEFR